MSKAVARGAALTNLNNKLQPNLNLILSSLELIKISLKLCNTVSQRQD